MFSNHQASDEDDTIRHVGVSLFAQGIRFFFQIASTIVLARLLVPDDFGLVAVVTVFTNFIAVVKDAGLNQATIQKGTVTERQVSTLVWINTGISIVLGLILMMLAPAVADFFDDPRLTTLTIVLALPLMLSGVGLQFRALLQRNMKFVAIAQVEIIALTFSVAIGISCALNDFGYWSLAIMQIANMLVQTILLVSFTRWIPKFVLEIESVKEMLNFGAHLSAFNFLNFFSRNADNFLIGKFVGMDALGFYSRAYTLLVVPLSQINAPLSSVFLPTLSKLVDEPERFSIEYLKLIRWVHFVTAPLAVIMCLYGKKLIVLGLGDQWTMAGSIFAVLAISAMFQPLGNFCGLLMTALGQSQRILKWGVFSSVLIVSSFIVGLPFGAIGVAFAYSAAIAIQQPLLSWYSLRYSPVTGGEYLRALLPGTLFALIVLALDFLILG